MKVLTVVGARPQFIKAAVVSRALRRVHREVLVHTGQHYDANMSDQFFRELEIPVPDRHLGVGSGSHAEQTAAMLVEIERSIIEERPDFVIVYGDTNSTLAGALAAAKLNVPIGHVEAGLRSFSRAMPEEINRVTTDHVSSLLFCPSDRAAANLHAEGVRTGVHVVGDVMLDALHASKARAESESRILESLRLEPGRYVLATIHRASNVDNAGRLRRIVQAFDQVDERVVFPVHPRTRLALQRLGWIPQNGITAIDPVGHLDMVRLQQHARVIVTDSGGVQKEAYWLAVPCVTVRDETEWTETVDAGWNVLSGSDTRRIADAIRTAGPRTSHPPLYGEAGAAGRIVERIA